MSNDEDSDVIDEETELYLYSLVHFPQTDTTQEDIKSPTVPTKSTEILPPTENEPVNDKINHKLILSRLDQVQNDVKNRLLQSKKRDLIYEKFFSTVKDIDASSPANTEVINTSTTPSTSAINLSIIEDSETSSNENESLYHIERNPFSGAKKSLIQSAHQVLADLQSDDTSDESLKEESKYCQLISKSNPTMNIQHIVNLSTCDLTQLPSVKADPWRLLHESSNQLSATRYYSRAANNATCERCLKKGHFTAQCHRSGPVCILCSKEGHKHIDCPQKICHACFQTGHSIDKCLEAPRLRSVICMRCRVKGHDKKSCPELWRQYHATIKPGRPVKPKKVRHLKISCCNCAKLGHYQNECSKRRPRSKFLTDHIPLAVSNYDGRNIYANIREKVHAVTSSSDMVHCSILSSPGGVDIPSTSSECQVEPPAACTVVISGDDTTNLRPSIRHSQPLGDFVPLEVEEDKIKHLKRHDRFKVSRIGSKNVSKFKNKTISGHSVNPKVKTSESNEMVEPEVIDLTKNRKRPKNCQEKNTETMSSNKSPKRKKNSYPPSNSESNSSKKKLLNLASQVSIRKLKELFPQRTEGKRILSKNMKKKLRRKLQQYICQGYVPHNENELTEKLEGWLYDVAAGEALTFKKRWTLQNSMSAALQSIHPEYSSPVFTQSPPEMAQTYLPPRGRRRSRTNKGRKKVEVEQSSDS